MELKLFIRAFFFLNWKRRSRIMDPNNFEHLTSNSTSSSRHWTPASLSVNRFGTKAIRLPSPWKCFWMIFIASDWKLSCLANNSKVGPTIAGMFERWRNSGNSGNNILETSLAYKVTRLPYMFRGLTISSELLFLNNVSSGKRAYSSVARSTRSSLMEWKRDKWVSSSMSSIRESQTRDELICFQESPTRPCWMNFRAKSLPFLVLRSLSNAA